MQRTVKEQLLLDLIAIEKTRGDELYAELRRMIATYAIYSDLPAAIKARDSRISELEKQLEELREELWELQVGETEEEPDTAPIAQEPQCQG